MTWWLLPLEEAARLESNRARKGDSDYGHKLPTPGHGLPKRKGASSSRSSGFDESRVRRGTGAQGGQFVAKGSSGSDVSKLQQDLGMTPTGTFDSGTAATVIAFQKRHGLVADGIVGRQTATALAGDFEGARSMDVGALGRDHSFGRRAARLKKARRAGGASGARVRGGRVVDALEEAEAGGLGLLEEEWEDVRLLEADIDWDPRLHPRGVLGRFVKVIGKLTPAGKEGPTGVQLPDGTRVSRDADGSLRVVRSGRIVRGIRRADVAAVDALDRSARGRQPKSLGGSVSFRDYRTAIGATALELPSDLVDGKNDLAELRAYLEKVRRSDDGYVLRQVPAIEARIAALERAERRGEARAPGTGPEADAPRPAGSTPTTLPVPEGRELPPAVRAVRDELARRHPESDGYPRDPVQVRQLSPGSFELRVAPSRAAFEDGRAADQDRAEQVYQMTGSGAAVHQVLPDGRESPFPGLRDVAQAAARQAPAADPNERIGALRFRWESGLVSYTSASGKYGIREVGDGWELRYDPEGNLDRFPGRGELVDTFDHRDAAVSWAERHARQRGALDAGEAAADEQVISASIPGLQQGEAFVGGRRVPTFLRRRGLRVGDVIDLGTGGEAVTVLAIDRERGRVQFGERQREQGSAPPGRARSPRTQWYNLDSPILVNARHVPRDETSDRSPGRDPVAAAAPTPSDLPPVPAPVAAAGSLSGPREAAQRTRDAAVDLTNRREPLADVIAGRGRSPLHVGRIIRTADGGVFMFAGESRSGRLRLHRLEQVPEDRVREQGPGAARGEDS